MKQITMIALMALLPWGIAAQAEGGHDHSETICSTVNQNLCVHLGIHNKLSTTAEGEFMVHFMALNPELIQNVQVELWMNMEGGHGHGSAPVEIKKVALDKYYVQNAWFVMPGTWTVKISFEFNGQKDLLEVPLNIFE